MRFALLAAALLAVSLGGLAGCLEGELSLLTAKEARAKADREADRWADDASLMMVVGFEAGANARDQLSQVLVQGSQPGAPQPDEDKESEMAMLGAVAGAEDDDVGDGRAPVWSFTYTSESNGGMFEVTVTTEGTLQAQQSEENGFGLLLAGRTLHDWAIDSDEGAKVARNDEEYAAAVADPDALVFTMLVQGDEAPIWVYGAESGGPNSDSDEDDVIVAVNAATGEALEDVDDLLTDVFGFVIREFGSESGSEIGAQASFGTGFDIELGGHGVLVVLVSISPPPLVPMDIVVTDPAGTDYAGTVPASVGTGLDSSTSVILNAIPTGTYGVSVSADLAVANNWEISWCTDGQAFIPQGSRACDHLPASAARGSTGHAADSLWETLSLAGRSPWA
ncbi:MAG: hypothetical protein QOJ26_1738 [Thermoplasmata archaeon]|nr:hypothetical protein [Thermoplasmata archaeon]